jgi:hypothetical protein
MFTSLFPQQPPQLQLPQSAAPAAIPTPNDKSPVAT